MGSLTYLHNLFLKISDNNHSNDKCYQYYTNINYFIMLWRLQVAFTYAIFFKAHFEKLPACAFIFFIQQMNKQSQEVT